MTIKKGKLVNALPLTSLPWHIGGFPVESSALGWRNEDPPSRNTVISDSKKSKLLINIMQIPKLENNPVHKLK